MKNKLEKTLLKTSVPESKIPQKRNISSKKKSRTSKTGLYSGDTRATFIVNEGKLNRIKAIAKWSRCSIKEIIDYAFETLIRNFEDKYGSVEDLKNEQMSTFK